MELGKNCSLLCAVCRIACFTCCVRRLCPCCVSPRPGARTERSVLCLGLQGAGKTTLLALLAGEQPPENQESTMGFAIKTVNVQKNLTFNFTELGGSEQIRTYWDRYYNNRHLLMYVVDSSCSEYELSESREVLSHCLCSLTLSALPLLVVCSKQDLTSGRTTGEMREQLKIGEVGHRSDVLVIGSSTHQPQATRDSVVQALVQLLEPQHTKRAS